MKLSCSQSDLKTNLSLISRAVPSRPNIPILTNVLLVADAKKSLITLTAFDETLGIRTHLRGDVEIGGEVALPAKLLSDIVSRLPEREITINVQETEDNAYNVTLSCMSGSFNIRGMRGKDFPELPTVEDSTAVELPVELLSQGLAGAIFAASTDDTKQILTGVHLSCKQDYLEFAATDGHRLSVVQAVAQEEQENPVSLPQDNFEVTIPARALGELEKILGTKQGGDGGNKVAIYFDQNQIIFDLGEQRITSRILQGVYPAYEKLIPPEFARIVTVDRKALLNSLELVAVLADQKNNLVKFHIDSIEEQISVSVEDKDVGNAQWTLPANIRGDSLEIAFNVRYFMEGLKALPSQEINIQINQATLPVILTPLGGLKMTYLIMPVQIRD